MDKGLLDMRIICVNTGNKYTEWYVNNLKHMIDTYSELKYDEFCVIREEKHWSVFNKLQMFDLYRDGENLYFDLDVCIKGPVHNLIRKDLTVLHAWWRDRYHTSLNSSVISWTGDVSYIYKEFMKQPEELEKKYNKGIDQYLEEVFQPKTYNKICMSMKHKEYEPEPKDFNIVLFNQRHHLMEEGWTGWWNSYFISKTI